MIFGALTLLRRGSQGPAVVQLQQALSNALSVSFAADGIFGATTESYVKEFQRRNNLTIDGIVGPSTWAALGITASASPGVVPPAEEQLPVASDASIMNVALPVAGALLLGALLFSVLRRKKGKK